MIPEPAPPERLFAALPADLATKIREVAGPELADDVGPSYPAVQALVLRLLTSGEREAALARLSPGEKGGGPVPLLRALFDFPAAKEATRISFAAELLGRTHWLRYVLGCLPGREPGREQPGVALPIRPDLVYKAQGFHFAPHPRAPARARWQNGRQWPFKEARAFTRTLGIVNQVEWSAYSRGDLKVRIGLRPKGIPGIPTRIYGTFAGIRDWIGAPNDEPAIAGFLTYREARALIRQLGIRGIGQWRSWVLGRLELSIPRPANVPVLPEIVYARCWRGYADFLGLASGAVPEQRGWRPFLEAREFARSLGLCNVTEWRRYAQGKAPELGKKPDDIPSNAESTYSTSGFRGYGDWLGTENVAATDMAYRPFADARRFARSLKLPTSEEWDDWSAGRRPDLPPRPPDVPAIPSRAYAQEGWRDWGDFLGTGNVHARNLVFRPFEEARAWARKSVVTKASEWRKLCRGELPDLERPADIPAEPHSTYGDKWTSWGDFLGTGAISTRERAFVEFDEARRYARSLELRSSTEWRAFCRGDMPDKSRPADIPAAPDVEYRDHGWTNWRNFLGNENVRRWRKKVRSFESARALVQSLGLHTEGEWREWQRGRLNPETPFPDDMPTAPRVRYRDEGWTSWGDFFGTGYVHPSKRVFMSFEEAREYARSLPIMSAADWRRFRAGELPGLKRPDDVPFAPNRHYRDRGWKGWDDFLGRDQENGE